MNELLEEDDFISIHSSSTTNPFGSISEPQTFVQKKLQFLTQTQPSLTSSTEPYSLYFQMKINQIHSLPRGESDDQNTKPDLADITVTQTVIDRLKNKNLQLEMNNILQEEQTVDIDVRTKQQISFKQYFNNKILKLKLENSKLALQNNRINRREDTVLELSHVQKELEKFLRNSTSFLWSNEELEQNQLYQALLRKSKTVWQEFYSVFPDYQPDATPSIPFENGVSPLTLLVQIQTLLATASKLLSKPSLESTSE